MFLFMWKSSAHQHCTQPGFIGRNHSGLIEAVLSLQDLIILDSCWFFVPWMMDALQYF